MTLYRVSWDISAKMSEDAARDVTNVKAAVTESLGH